jgi:hypothetical protein
MLALGKMLGLALAVTTILLIVLDYPRRGADSFSSSTRGSGSQGPI